MPYIKELAKVISFFISKFSIENIIGNDLSGVVA